MASFRERIAQLSKPNIEAVGLEIGTSALKVVELKAGVPPSLSALAIRPMPPGLIQDDQIVNAQALADEIKALYQDAGINIRKKPYVVTAVSNSVAITRNIFVPKMSLSELEEAIKWEAERYIPYPLEEVTLDYYPLDHPDDIPDDGQIEVIIAASRLDLIEQQVNYLKLAGLEPVIIDIKPFALLRSLKGSLLGDKLSKLTLVGNSYTENDEIGVVLEIAASGTTITLVRGERVLMNRNVSASGDDFTAALQRAFNLDFDSAENIKVGYGTATIPTEDEEELLNFDTEREQFSPGRVYEALRPVLVDPPPRLGEALNFLGCKPAMPTSLA
ncbi:MAG: type IV pilus assembly protein PilM [Deinococcales bacterium]